MLTASQGVELAWPWLALAVAFCLVRLLAGRAGTGAWAFDAPWRLGALTAWLPWLAVLVALVPIAARALGTMCARLVSDRAGRALLVILPALTLMALPDRLWLLGDFWLRQTNLRLSLHDISAIVPQAMPLDLLVHHVATRELITRTGLEANTAGRALGVLDVLAMGVAALGLAHEFARTRSGRAVAWATLIGSGALQLWTGYNKGQAEMPLAWLFVSWLGLRLLRNGRGFVSLSAAFAIAVGFHRVALLLAPAWAYAMLRAPLGNDPAAARRARWAGFGVVGLALAVCAPFLARAFRVVDAGPKGTAALPVGAGDPTRALTHARDQLWQALASVPFLPAALLAARPATAGAESRDARTLLLLATVPAIVLSMAFGPMLGPLRDADSFVPPGIALAVLAAWGLARLVDQLTEPRGVVAFVVLATMTMALQPVVLTASLPLALARVEDYAESTGGASDAERARLWAFVGTRRLETGEPEAAAAAFERAAGLGPSPVVLRQWAIAERMAGNLERTREVYRELLQRAPDDPASWRDFGRFSAGTGDTANALRARARLEALRTHAR